MTTTIEVYDTTLRDGTQGENVSLSVADKLKITRLLDDLGVAYIEGGWPGSNPKDAAYFERVRGLDLKHAKITAFGMTCRVGSAPDDDDNIRALIDAQTPVVTVVGKTSLLHVRDVIRATPEENLRLIRESLAYLKAQGREVIYDAEHFFDGYKLDAAYTLQTLQAALDGGAEMLVLCDTNGGSLPRDIARIVGVAKEKLNTRLGIHTHNDCGLGVANGLAAVEAGATQIQGTINGYGERTGNCNLTSIIPLLALKMNLPILPAGSLARLKELSEFVNEIANIRHDPRQPWVGQTAFAHKGGMHVHAIDRVARSYEHINPAAVGNTRRVLVSDMSGRTNILLKAKELGFKLAADAPETRTITDQIKRRENEGYEYEAAEASLALLIGRALKETKLPFTVNAYHVSMRRDGASSICEATVKVRVNNENGHTVAEGDGPVNALDKALRTALVKFYPQLKDITLTDYKVRILETSTGTGARTRVLIHTSDGRQEWGTVGVSENIIEASLQALVDSLEYALTRK